MSRQTLGAAPHRRSRSEPVPAGTRRSQSHAYAPRRPRRLPARQRKSGAAAARRQRRAVAALEGWLQSPADLLREELFTRNVGVAQALLGARQALLRGVGCDLEHGGDLAGGESL